MAERLPPLNAVRYFEVAARHLSFTKAAAELNVTHSAISHQIKALEDWLGVRLFRRLNRAVVLTEEGQAYVKPVREAFERLGDATRELRRREGAGVLTVSVMPSFAAKWLVPRLRGFRHAPPDADAPHPTNTPPLPPPPPRPPSARPAGGGRRAHGQRHAVLRRQVARPAPARLPRRASGRRRPHLGDRKAGRFRARRCRRCRALRPGQLSGPARRPAVRRVRVPGVQPQAARWAGAAARTRRPR